MCNFLLSWLCRLIDNRPSLNFCMKYNQLMPFTSSKDIAWKYIMGLWMYTSDRAFVIRHSCSQMPRKQSNTSKIWISDWSIETAAADPGLHLPLVFGNIKTVFVDVRTGRNRNLVLLVWNYDNNYLLLNNYGFTMRGKRAKKFYRVLIGPKRPLNTDGGLDHEGPLIISL